MKSLFQKENQLAILKEGCMVSGFVIILKPNTRFLSIIPINWSVQCGHTSSIIIYKLLRLNLWFFFIVFSWCIIL